MLFPLLVGLDQKTILSQRIRGFVIKCLEEVDRPPARVAAPGLRLSPWLFLSPPPPGRDALGLLPFGRKGRQGPEPPRPAPSARDGPLEARTMLSFSFVPTSLGTRSLTGGASGAGGARRGRRGPQARAPRAPPRAGHDAAERVAPASLGFYLRTPVYTPVFFPFKSPRPHVLTIQIVLRGKKILPTDAHTHTHTHEKQESDSMQGALREHRGSGALRAREPPPPAPRGRGLRAAPPGTQAPESAGRVQRRWALPPPANGQVALPPASLLPCLL